MDSSSYLMSDYKKIQTIFIFGVWNLLLNAAESIEGEGTIQVIMYPLRTKYVLIKITESGNCKLTHVNLEG